MKYTCDGENINPPLEFIDVPETTESLALIMSDPDAPGGDWVHWLVWNIDPDTTFIDEDSVPKGIIQGKNSFTRSNHDYSYGGPCPPSWIHYYEFKLYAVDCKLDLPVDSGKEEVIAAIQGHLLAESTLVGLYGRQ